MKQTLRDALAAGQGVITRRSHPELHAAIDRALKRGELVAWFRGVYGHAGDTSLRARCRALLAADPDAVLTGAAAAAVHGWTEVPVPGVVTAASLRLHSRDGFVMQRRVLAPQLVRRGEGLPCTSRALTALDLVDELGEGIIDLALRKGVTLDQLWSAHRLSGPRRGDRRRRLALERSRTQPWSAAEREAHRALGARLPLWRANRRVHDRWGELVAICDIAFDGLKLDIEIDGRQHLDPGQWARDLRRDQALAALGWQVVRFAASDVLDDPARFAAAVVAIVEARRRALKLTRT